MKEVVWVVNRRHLVKDIIELSTLLQNELSKGNNVNVIVTNLKIMVERL